MVSTMLEVSHQIVAKGLVVEQIYGRLTKKYTPAGIGLCVTGHNLTSVSLQLLHGRFSVGEREVMGW